MSKIDKEKIVPGKNGAKYYNFDVILNDAPNQFGKDASICAPQTKEQHINKEKRVYIGNGKTVFKSAYKEQPEQAVIEKNQEEAKKEYTTRNGITTPDDSDLPF